MHRIAQIQHRGATIVLVSHDLESIRRLCPRAIWLHEGQIQGDGPTTQTASRYLAHLWTESRETGGSEEHPRLDEEAAADALAMPAEPESTGAQPPTGVSSPVQEPPTRWGSGELRIEKVELFNAAGEAARVFQAGGGFRVRLWYNAVQRIEHPAFGIGLYDEQGNRINGPNTIWSGAPIESVHGRGFVDYVADAFPLLPGRYDLTAAVYDEFVVHPYDHWHRMLTFSVVPGDLERQDGLCYIPCRWNHERSPASPAGQGPARLAEGTAGEPGGASGGEESVS